MKFTKMQGCGNDYVYINCFEEKVPNPSETAVKLSDRHFGIGGDGVILICPSDKADCTMDMYNLDGSRGKMCGNGIRCVGKYAYDHGIVNKTDITVETLSGIKKLKLVKNEKTGKIDSVTVDMGHAEFEPEKIPMNTEAINRAAQGGIVRKSANGCITGLPVEVNGICHEYSFVSMGNPHAVTFVEDVDNLDITACGPDMETHELFPEKANIEFVKVVDRSHISMRVWERGSGETFACGTGACACVVACAENGLTDRNVEVTLLGGKLNIEYREDGSVLMTGPATEVFNGEIDDSRL